MGSPSVSTSSSEAISTRYTLANSGSWAQRSWPLSMRSANLIVFARGEALARRARSMDLRMARLPSAGPLTSVSSPTSCATADPNCCSRSARVVPVSSTVSCSQAAATISGSLVTEATRAGHLLKMGRIRLKRILAPVIEMRMRLDGRGTGLADKIIHGGAVWYDGWKSPWNQGEIPAILLTDYHSAGLFRGGSS